MGNGISSITDSNLSAINSGYGLFGYVSFVTEDGTFDLIMADYKRESFGGYIGTFSDKGEVIDYIWCFSSLYYFTDLVGRYFETELT